MTEAARPSQESAANAGGRPEVVQVAGRAATRENSSLCGEYLFAGMHAGRPAYRKRGSDTAIRYHPSHRRWVIDRDGLRDSDICVAYADAIASRCSGPALHPADSGLQWHVWETPAAAHVLDMDLVVLDAPRHLSFVGRSPAAAGRYELVGVHHGRPSYRQIGGAGYVIRFYGPDSRWLLAAPGNVGTTCSAFAEGADLAHPASGDMLWRFWDGTRKAFYPDVSAKALSCPPAVHIVGRLTVNDDPKLCGTYQLTGTHDGKPMYSLPGTRNILRFSARCDRWLIDCEGMEKSEKSGIFSRLRNFIFNSDEAASGERCNAYADARGSLHPGVLALEWHVWESRSGRFWQDTAFRCTTAPLVVNVRGRDPSRDNAEVCGDYLLVGAHSGRPAYVKRDSRMALRFWSPASRWCIDPEGLRESDCCAAFMDDAGAEDHPAEPGKWHVFETSRGRHLPDPCVVASVPADAPSTWQTILGAAAPAVQSAGCSVPILGQKRAPLDEHGGDSKRLRVDTDAGARFFALGDDGPGFATMNSHT
eukprot:CAMPEP_0170241890 /NCGR_PEP_ID=MMETSP0116_2-20130129/20716_1 /TAXON_ID=400756 /ORGANISM="Durinskia baltica, Strain CSIRO CS-38" /LENGTH=533 /DNA_ID=CAMNT_0010492735 /DNA_START=24 /DNA_END=1622 /DNA_ORIENTATION=-